MDKELNTVIRQIESQIFSQQDLVTYIKLSLRAGKPIDLSYFAGFADLAGLQTYVSGQNLTVHGYEPSEISEQIEDHFLVDLANLWHIDPNTPPVDTDPYVLYLGYIVDQDLLVALISTQREQAGEHMRLLGNGDTALLHAFWYGIYHYSEADDAFMIHEAWNSANAPQDYPATLETITNNHQPLVISLINEIEQYHDIAQAAIDEFEEEEDQAEETYLENQLGYIEQFVNELPPYTYDELSESETIASGHTANLKVELTATDPDGEPTANFANVRVWLSRMTTEDGMDSDYPVEIEIYNPIDEAWQEYLTYESGYDED